MGAAALGMEGREGRRRSLTLRACRVTQGLFKINSTNDESAETSRLQFKDAAIAPTPRFARIISRYSLFCFTPGDEESLSCIETSQSGLNIEVPLTLSSRLSVCLVSWQPITNLPP